MPPLPADPRAEQFLARLGELTVEWNGLEGLLGMMLAAFVGEWSKASILTASMTNPPSQEALKTFANEFSREPLRGHILHFEKCFENLRGYRNWFVHSVAAVGFNETNEVIGVSQSISARSRLVSHQSITTVADLSSTVEKIRVLQQYGTRIVCDLGFFGPSPPGHMPLGDGPKPELPPKFEKPRKLIREDLS